MLFPSSVPPSIAPPGETGRVRGGKDPLSCASGSPGRRPGLSCLGDTGASPDHQATPPACFHPQLASSDETTNASWVLFGTWRKIRKPASFAHSNPARAGVSPPCVVPSRCPELIGSQPRGKTSDYTKDAHACFIQGPVCLDPLVPLNRRCLSLRAGRDISSF